MAASLSSVPLVPSAVVGVTVPRIQTPPLVEGPPGPCGCGCALSPDTSFGFAVCELAVHVGRPLDPWQRHVAIHAGELLPSGLPRFRTVLVLVARQNGKTELCVILALFWLFVEQVAVVFGVSQKLDYAKESWSKAIRLARLSGDPELVAASAKRHVHSTNGEQEWRVPLGVGDEVCRYKIGASNSDGGRSLTLDRVIADELRQQVTYDAWDAVVPATNAVEDAQVWAITNQGSDRSVVLNDLRGSAVAFIESGAGDSRLGLFEYSAPEGSDPQDVSALAQANPNMGRRIPTEVLLNQAAAAVERGGDKLKGFLTEVMCIRVRSLLPEPVPLELFTELVDESVPVPDSLVVSYFVGPGRETFSVCVAGWLPDGRAFVDVAATGDVTGGLSELRRVVAEVTLLQISVDGADGLPKRWRPAVVGDAWSLRPVLEDLQASGVDPWVWSWSEVAAACGGFQDAVMAGSLAHRGRAEVVGGLEQARVRALTNGWVWDLKGSGAPMECLMGVTLAHRALLLADTPVGDWSKTFG